MIAKIKVVTRFHAMMECLMANPTEAKQMLDRLLAAQTEGIEDENPHAVLDVMDREIDDCNMQKVPDETAYILNLTDDTYYLDE